MRPTRRALQAVMLLMALLAPMASDAANKPSFPAPPPPGRFISDTAGVIGEGDGSEIDRLAAALIAEKGYPIGVATIRSLAAEGADGYTIERYAAELLQSWHQDERMRSHGMLLVVASKDRVARIQLGSAWGRAHDDRARRVMDRLILPAFRKGEFSAGILNGVRGFDAMGRQLALPAVGQPSWMPCALIVEGLDDPWWTLPVLVAGGLVLVVGLVSLARRGRRSWAWAAAAFIFALLLARFFGSAEASGSGGGATGDW
jgi:uncharacterized protein